MGRRERGLSMISTAAEVFDLPADVISSLPHVEMIGDLELLLNSHQGILSYSEGQIDVNAGHMVIRVKGEKLELVGMSGDALRIKGRITSVEPIR